MILNPSISRNESRRRSWRTLAKLEPISAERLAALCVGASLAGVVFIVTACVVIDRFSL
jgi:hypothetical protein